MPVEFAAPADVSAWMARQPERVAAALAARTCLRALPQIGLGEEAAVGPALLPLYRAALSGAVNAVVASAATQAASITASRDLERRGQPLLDFPLPFRSGSWLGYFRVLPGEGGQYPKMTSQAFLLQDQMEWGMGEFDRRHPTLGMHIPTILSAGNARDAQSYEDAPEIEAIFAVPLWGPDPLPEETYALARRGEVIEGEVFRANAMPKELGDALTALRERWAAMPDVWGFWARWYEGMLAGEPLPWDLQEAVALIPDEVWEGGPAAVAAHIAEIEARLALKARLAEAEADIVRAHSQRLGIGGNNPPEALDDLDEVPKPLELVWEPFAELKAETDAQPPDTGRVERAISKLTGLLAACGKWTGGKLDAAAGEFAKAIGKAGGAGAVVWIASHSPQINAVMVSAKDWLLALLNLA